MSGYMNSGCTCPACGKSSLVEIGSTFRDMVMYEEHCVNRDCRYYSIFSNDPDAPVENGRGIRSIEDYESAMELLGLGEYEV